MKVKLLSIQGEEKGEIELDSRVFDGKVNRDLLAQVVKAYIANQQKILTASSKTRGEVKGSGQKPWRQKGTGRARVGERRNPLWRGGGVVFGPHPREVSRKIPKKMKIRALQSALNAKLKDSEIVFLDKLEVNKPKTKVFHEILGNLDLRRRSLFVDRALSREAVLASRNIKDVELRPAADINAYEVLNCRKLVVTKEGILSLEKRIKKVLS